MVFYFFICVLHNFMSVLLVLLILLKIKSYHIKFLTRLTFFLCRLISVHDQNLPVVAFYSRDGTIYFLVHIISLHITCK